MSNKATTLRNNGKIQPHLLALALAKESGLEQKIEHLHRAHVEICKRAGISPESFQTFALEILNTPEEARAELLDPIPPESYEPTMSYQQYQSPTAPDWKMSW